MKVYLVEEHIDYEGSTVQGVFSTQDQAEQLAKSLILEYYGRTKSDSTEYVVLEWVVDNKDNAIENPKEVSCAKIRDRKAQFQDIVNREITILKDRKTRDESGLD